MSASCASSASCMPVMYLTACSSAAPSSTAAASNTALCFAVSRENHESSHFAGDDGGADLGRGPVAPLVVAATPEPAASGAAQPAAARTTADVARWPRN